MNKCIVIGNLTRDPELRKTQSGIAVCSFTIAANRRRKVEGQPEADFFRVTVWRNVAESCARYLKKGRKVGISGPVSVRTYDGNDGRTYASLELNADEVEFLSPREGGSGFTEVSDDELPEEFR